MNHKRLPKKNIHDEENPYLLSFSDILSGILIIFILLTIAISIQLKKSFEVRVSQIENVQKKQEELDRITDEYNQKQEELDRIEEEISDNNKKLIKIKNKYNRNSEKISEFLIEIKNQLEKKGIDVKVTYSVLVIPNEEVSFDSGSHKINQDVRDRIVSIGIVIYNTLINNDNYKLIDSVFIEGHTDPNPLGYCYKMPDGKSCVFENDNDGNWELSVFRAMSVLQAWEKDYMTQKLTQLKNDDDQPLFAISGYSKTRPWLDSNQNPYPNEKQRRINLRFNQKHINFNE